MQHVKKCKIVQEIFGDMTTAEFTESWLCWGIFFDLIEDFLILFDLCELLGV